MQRKWLVGGLAVALVAALLVGGQMLMTRRTAPATDAGARDVLSGNGSPSSSSGQASANSSSEASHAAALAPTKPAAPGEGLKLLTAPPSKTAGGFNAAFLPAGSRYSVTVRPYGYGPVQGSNPTLIVLIASAKGLDGAAGAEKLVGRNALVLIEAGRTGAYSKGGSFSAILTLKPDPRGSVLSLGAPRLGTSSSK
jgi:hypothetical protein